MSLAGLPSLSPRQDACVIFCCSPGPFEPDFSRKGMGGGGAERLCLEVPFLQGAGLGWRGLPTAAVDMGSSLSPRGPRGLGPVSSPGSCPASRHCPVPVDWCQVPLADFLGPEADSVAQHAAGTTSRGPGGQPCPPQVQGPPQTPAQAGQQSCAFFCPEKQYGWAQGV